MSLFLYCKIPGYCQYFGLYVTPTFILLHTAGLNQIEFFLITSLCESQQEEQRNGNKVTSFMTQIHFETCYGQP